MKNCEFLLALAIFSNYATAATWRCTDMTTYHSYISSQNVASDRCEKISDADPSEADRYRPAITALQSDNVRDLVAGLEDREAKEAAKRKKEMDDESYAAAHSVVTCKNKSACAKAFTLAQVYVQQHSDQKIQVATDTIIDTYNPTEGGNVGITVTRMPRAGSTETLTITPHCKLDGAFYESACRLKRTSIYLGFRPFIEKSL